MADGDFIRQLAGYSLTTAEITYRLPDHPELLQMYVWQEYDVHPRFPRLSSFLEYWRKNIDGPLHQVRVAHARLIHPREIAFHQGQFLLN